MCSEAENFIFQFRSQSYKFRLIDDQMQNPSLSGTEEKEARFQAPNISKICGGLAKSLPSQKAPAIYGQCTCQTP
jgi:hypothetical protein